MSSFSFKAWFLFSACAVVASVSSLHAGEWLGGAVLVGASEGSVVIEEAGAEPFPVLLKELPLYLSGVLQVRAQTGGSVFLRGSNGMFVYNAGAGFFAIERFEQQASASNGVEQSRMILHLRQGLLAVDNRMLGDSSQLIVETPLGRVSVQQGLWLIRIFYDERNHLYNLSVECADGTVRFADRFGADYTVTTGQRLSGAGTAGRLSLEIADMSGDGASVFEEFEQYMKALESAGFSSEKLSAKMRAASASVAKVAADLSDAPIRTEGDRRPLILEYAPRSPEVTPFRAEIRPPSAYEADLF